ncbi:MAG TPA: hypothetical protein VGQ83_42250 [Polyangia bacterium]|jgi:hypothetical protein
MRAAAVALVFVLVSACRGGEVTATGADAGDAGETADAARDAGAAADAAREAGAAADAAPDAGGSAEAGAPVGDGGADAATQADAGAGCFLSTVGVYGECLPTADCAALGSHVSTPGYCPGPADIQCCTRAPNVADNPPVPAGWRLMQQSQVTAAMTAWAVAILHDPTTYPMFSTTPQTFGTLTVLARVEWHPPDFQNSVVHRGVTLYVPTP